MQFNDAVESQLSPIRRRILLLANELLDSLAANQWSEAIIRLFERRAEVRTRHAPSGGDRVRAALEGGNADVRLSDTTAAK